MCSPRSSGCSFTLSSATGKHLSSPASPGGCFNPLALVSRMQPPRPGTAPSSLTFSPWAAVSQELHPQHLRSPSYHFCNFPILSWNSTPQPIFMHSGSPTAALRLGHCAKFFHYADIPKKGCLTQSFLREASWSGIMHGSLACPHLGHPSFTLSLPLTPNLI